jgi:6-phosphogluconate dehydrogenase
LHDALLTAITISYAQGLALLSHASADLKMDIPLTDVVKIWRSGCIIRSTMLEKFYDAYRDEPGLQNILLHPSVSNIISDKIAALRQVIILAIGAAMPVNGLMTALGYLDAYSTAELPINLIQALTRKEFFIQPGT